MRIFLAKLAEKKKSLLPLQSQNAEVCGTRATGDVAQLVEQRTENPCVGGSIPSITTKIQKTA